MRYRLNEHRARPETPPDMLHWRSKLSPTLILQVWLQIQSKQSFLFSKLASIERILLLNHLQRMSMKLKAYCILRIWIHRIRPHLRITTRTQMATDRLHLIDRDKSIERWPLTCCFSRLFSLATCVRTGRDNDTLGPTNRTRNLVPIVATTIPLQAVSPPASTATVLLFPVSSFLVYQLLSNFSHSLPFLFLLFLSLFFSNILGTLFPPLWSLVFFILFTYFTNFGNIQKTLKDQIVRGVFLPLPPHPLEQLQPSDGQPLHCSKPPHRHSSFLHLPLHLQTLLLLWYWLLCQADLFSCLLCLYRSAHWYASFLYCHSVDIVNVSVMNILKLLTLFLPSWLFRTQRAGHLWRKKVCPLPLDHS